VHSADRRAQCFSAVITRVTKSRYQINPKKKKFDKRVRQDARYSLIRSKNERYSRTRTRYKTGKVSEGPLLRQANLRKIV